MDAIVALNAGSSSVKFACFDAADLSPVLAGQVGGIGGETRLTVGGEAADIDPAADHAAAIGHVLGGIVAPRVGRCAWWWRGTCSGPPPSRRIRG